MLQITDLTYRIGHRTLLDRAAVSLPARARAGLVGRNGAGKSTLLHLITGELSPEDGTIAVPRNWRIGQVAQEAPSGPESLIDVVLAADTERARLLAEAESDADPHRIAEIHLRLADIGAHSAEARAAAILGGLGFTPAQQRGPCSDLSGGWRMRVALAAALFAQPDLLLLDEPTNYLDLEGTLWLQSFLSRYPYSLVIVSHDRDLLDSAVDTIVHLADGKLTLYRGGYSQFDRQRREKQALQVKLRAKQIEQRKHMEAFIERFRYKATKARQAQSRLKALEKMEPIAELIEEHVHGFSIPSPKRQKAPPIVAMEGVAAGYQPGIAVLQGLDLSIGSDDRIGLLGQNGNGKSTLAKLISGRLKPQAGSLRLASKLSVGFFAQHQLDELNPRHSAYDHVRALLPDLSEAAVRAKAGALGFPGAKMNTPAGELSGGEKARLLLGLAAFPGVDLLILDEPTNHLDIDSRDALVAALADYEGAVIVISHDRRLLDASVDRLWLVANRTVTPFDGDIDDYRRIVLDQRDAPIRTPAGPRPAAQERRREAAQRREQLAPLRDKIRKTEAVIASLQKEIQKIDGLLADPALYGAGATALTARTKERAEAQKRLAAAEEQWLRCSGRYPRAKAPWVGSPGTELEFAL